MGVQRILLVVVEHPSRQNTAAARNDSGNAVADEGQVLNQDASVDGLVVNALLSMFFDDVQKVIGSQVFDIAVDAFKCLINRHRANGNR